MNPPDKTTQILYIHAGLIHQVVKATLNRDLRPALEPILHQSAENGWHQLVATIRKIFNGHRGHGLLQGLDSEDQVIIQAILDGIKNPATLPDMKQPAHPGVAASSFANLIHATAHGDLTALQMLGSLADQMNAMGGDMRGLAASFRPLVDGERDIEKLSRGLSPTGHALLLDILAELAQLQPH